MLTTKTKFLTLIIGVSMYAMMVNINISRRVRAIEEERRLADDLGNGACSLTPPKQTVATAGSTKTLLASFPGSGKRFTYEVIAGLTDHAPGDDWNFSGHEGQTLHIKTGYPHHEGTWSWGDKMDQVVLLMRNPRWALPSYHTMRFELDFSESFVDSYLRIPYVYTVRPSVASWVTWRDINFEKEMQNWIDYIDFYMTGE